MPVAIGDELKLENNRVNAYYDNLFRKLNVAKAWTNTETTESGGTVTVIRGDGEILTNMTSGYNNWYVGNCPNYGSCVCVIDGKLYIYNGSSLNQVGSSSNWMICSSARCSFPINIYAINSSNELYHFYQVSSDGTYTSVTQAGSGIYWTYISAFSSSNGIYGYGIGDGKLYFLKSQSTSSVTMTQIGSDTGWTKVQSSDGISPSGVGLMNGYCYRFTSSGSLTLLNQNNDFVDIVSGNLYQYTTGSFIVLNSSGEIYIYNYPNLVKSDFDGGTVKQISNGCERGPDSSLVTTDGKLFYSNGSDEWTELGSGINWTWTCSGEMNKRILAIGNGRIYLFTYDQDDEVYSMSQVGTSTGYKKIFGDNQDSRERLALAWTGNVTEATHTVYTTSHPQVGNNAYADRNLTVESTITEVNGSTISDATRTYTADVSRNTSFNKIPLETANETISAIDLLKATE